MTRSPPIAATIITMMPRFVAAYQEFGVLKAALRAGSLKLAITDLRDHAVDHRGTVDDKPYGGGDGMVLRPEPLARAIADIAPQGTTAAPYIIYTSPKGKPFTQGEAEQLAQLARTGRPLGFICGRFAGIDQRIEDRYVDQTYSLGDFVVSGGELPVLMMVDAICRGLPGVMGSPASYQEDSLGGGMAGGLEYPLYTRPEQFEGMTVPKELLSGDHEKIRSWRQRASEALTAELRPDLLCPGHDDSP